MKRIILKVMLLVAIPVVVWAGKIHPVSPGTDKASQLEIIVAKRPVKDTQSVEVSVQFANTYQRNPKSSKLPVDFVRLKCLKDNKVTFEADLAAKKLINFTLTKEQYKSARIELGYNEGPSNCPPMYQFELREFETLALVSAKDTEKNLSVTASNVDFRLSCTDETGKRKWVTNLRYNLDRLMPVKIVKIEILKDNQVSVQFSKPVNETGKKELRFDLVSGELLEG